MKIGVAIRTCRPGPSKYQTDSCEFSMEVDCPPEQDISTLRSEMAAELERECEVWHAKNQVKYKQVSTPRTVDNRSSMFDGPRIKDVIEED